MKIELINNILAPENVPACYGPFGRNNHPEQNCSLKKGQMFRGCTCGCGGSGIRCRCR